MLACRPHLRGVQGAEKAIGEVCDGRAAKPQKAAVGITGGGGEDSGGSGRGIDRGVCMQRPHSATTNNAATTMAAAKHGGLQITITAAAKHGNLQPGFRPHSAITANTV